MSNWSFAMNERCYENDYIRALTIPSRAPALARFIDDEFSILILSFGTLASRFSEDTLCIGAVLCECWICMYTQCVRRCIFSCIQCAMCMSTNTVQSFNVHSFDVRSSHSIISSQLSSSLTWFVQHFFRFSCRKSNVLARKRVVVWTKRNETKRTIKWSSKFFTVSGSYLNVIIASPLHIDTFFLSLRLLCFQKDDSKKVTATMQQKNTHTKENEKKKRHSIGMKMHISHAQ